MFVIGGWKIIDGAPDDDEPLEPVLTDDDLLLVEGKKDELMGRLEAKLGKSKAELQKLFTEL